MKPDCKHALSLWLSRAIDADELTHPILFANAAVLPNLDPVLKGKLICQQGFRPDYLAIQTQGFSSFPILRNALDEVQTKHALFLIGRNRRWNEQKIAVLWNGLGPGERLIIAGDKSNGIASLRKWFSGHIEGVESFSKYHAIVFWAKKRDGTTLPLDQISRRVEEYHLADGMFSSDGPDKGSQMLVEHFSDRMVGKIADFGAGWGYLSKELLSRSSRVTKLDLFEADYASLQAAKQNLSDCEFAEFHWCDVTSELKKTPYDWVIMNPPFHSGRAAEPELGKKFIHAAASTLPKGGRLLMVANQNLPYEDSLKKLFRAVEMLETKEGFKVFEALR